MGHNVTTSQELLDQMDDAKVSQFLREVWSQPAAVCCLTKLDVLMELLREPYVPRTTSEIAAATRREVATVSPALEDLRAKGVAAHRGSAWDQEYYSLNGDEENMTSISHFLQWLSVDKGRLKELWEVIPLEICEGCVNQERRKWQGRVRKARHLARRLLCVSLKGVKSMNGNHHAYWETVKSKDLMRIKHLAAGGAVLIFGLWEGIRHLFLMRVPMLTEHILSLCVEGALTFLVIVTVFRLVDMLEKERARLERLSQLFAGGVESDNRAEAALQKIVAAITTIQSEYAGWEPSVIAHVGTILEEVKAIRKLVKDTSVAPHVVRKTCAFSKPVWRR